LRGVPGAVPGFSDEVFEDAILQMFVKPAALRLY